MLSRGSMVRRKASKQEAMKRRAHAYRRYLKELTQAVRAYIVAVDAHTRSGESTRLAGLESELRRLLAYAQSARPSRSHLTGELGKLTGKLKFLTSELKLGNASARYFSLHDRLVALRPPRGNWRQSRR